MVLQVKQTKIKKTAKTKPRLSPGRSSVTPAAWTTKKKRHAPAPATALWVTRQPPLVGSAPPGVRLITVEETTEFFGQLGGLRERKCSRQETHRPTPEKMKALLAGGQGAEQSQDASPQVPAGRHSCAKCVRLVPRDGGPGDSLKTGRTRCLQASIRRLAYTTSSGPVLVFQGHELNY